MDDNIHALAGIETKRLCGIEWRIEYRAEIFGELDGHSEEVLDFVGRSIAGFDHFESDTSVVAGLFPATTNFKAKSRIVGVAGTSPATTNAKVVHLDRDPL